MDGDGKDEAPSNALEGPHRQARSRACNRTTGSRRAGASRHGAAEECVDKAQEECAIEVQKNPEVVEKGYKDKAPSNALE